MNQKYKIQIKIPKIIIEEIHIVLQYMNNGQCLGEGRITSELLKTGGDIVFKSI